MTMARINLGTNKFDSEQPAPTPPATQTSEPTTQRLEEATPKPAEATFAKPAPRPAKRASTAKSPELGGEAPGSDQKQVGVPVHLPDDLEARLVAHLARTKLAHPDVLMLAIESTYPRLASLVRDAVQGDESTATTVTTLFERETVPAPRVTPGANRNKHTVRMSKRNRDILDAVTTEVGAPTRMLLIITAYRDYLPPLPTES